MHAAFKSVFPIISYSGNAALEYVGYRLGEPAFDVKECVLRGVTFAVPLRVKVRLINALEDYERRARQVEDLEVLLDLAQEEEDAPAMKEVAAGLGELERDFKEWQLQLLMGAEEDQKNAEVLRADGAEDAFNPFDKGGHRGRP